jgi:hypothetical protein
MLKPVKNTKKQPKITKPSQGGINDKKKKKNLKHFAKTTFDISGNNEATICEH